MKKFSEALLWILTDALVIFGLTFLPSFFSLFCFLTAMMVLPVEEWQTILRKILNKSIRSIIIALLLAFTISLFPLSVMIRGISNVINPTSSEKIIVYHEETSTPSESSQENTNLSQNNTTSVTHEIVSEKPTHPESDVVYRTPSGKRYHLSPQCGGENSYEVSIDEAITDGLTPCKKCAE